MGYFPNGTSGMDYMERYCFRCSNWRDSGDGRGEGCPIMDLHLLWNYDAVGEDKDKTKELALNMFIKRDDKNCCNHRCAMFREKRKPKIKSIPLFPQVTA